MKLSEKNYKRIVIKVGSSILCPQGNECDSKTLSSISEQVSRLIKEGRDIVLVSSGAIAMGMHLLKLDKRPKELSLLQAASASGQHILMNSYRGHLERHGIKSAQVLLTWDDFNDRKRYLNAKNTLNTLLKYGVVPIVNENDTVSTDEIKFGDNDRLSALVATLINADILVILSDVDGLLDKDKKVIPLVGEITTQIKALASPTFKKTCVGGMASKIEAAKIAMGSGIPCVITNGGTQNIILSVVKEAEKHGTLFLAKGSMDARERWIAFGTKPKGKILVDDGAKDALLDKKSLLCVGVLDLEGNFEKGDIVSITDRQGNEFARGKVNLSSKELDRVKGKRFAKEVIHRDNIAII